MAKRKMSPGSVMENPFRRVNLSSMKSGETIVCGPFSKGANLNGPSGLIGANIHKLEAKGLGKWAMRKAIIVDPTTCESAEVYLVTRLEGERTRSDDSVADATESSNKIPFECY